jgi:hypothetical protein
MPPQRVCAPSMRQSVKRGLCPALTINQHGYRLRFYPSNHSGQLWVDDSLREPELRLVKYYLRRGDDVIVAGANVGDTVLTASIKVGSSGRVWAIEPHPRTFEFLVGNIMLNGVSNIEAPNVVGAPDGGNLAFCGGRRDVINRVGETGVFVRAQRLDELVG